MATAKATWKRLRQTFMTKLSEEPLKRSGDGAYDDEKDKWAFFDSLLFLKDTCTPRETEGNFSIGDNTNNTLSGDAGSNLSDVDLDADVGDDSSSQISISEPASDSRPASSISTSTPILKKTKVQRISGRRDALGESLIRVEEEKMEYLKRKEEYRQKRQEMVQENLSRKEIDEDESFFDSILPHIKKLDASSKIQFRISVLQLVQKYQLQSEQISAQSSTEHQMQVTEKHPATTQQNNLQPSSESHFTNLQFQQNNPSTSNHSSPHFPQNEYYNPGNPATYSQHYTNPSTNNHYGN